MPFVPVWMKMAAVSPGLRSARALGTALRHVRRLGRPDPQVYQGHCRERGGQGPAYRCEALYLDPGWDADFATFRWGEEWLGPRKAFVEEMRAKYGLKVSLHTPLAPSMSLG